MSRVFYEIDRKFEICYHYFTECYEEKPMDNFFAPTMTREQVNAISNLGLAHMGDGVYEILCRTYLCTSGNHTVKNLHKRTVALVNAPTQARLAQKILPSLTQEEQDFYRRGKNSHTHAAPKAASPAEYASATGLEALLGALYLLGRRERINALFCMMMEGEPANGL